MSRACQLWPFAENWVLVVVTVVCSFNSGMSEVNAYEYI